MEIQKTLDQIAWNVTEEQYRADPALSYSTLATYEREGFDNLDHLYDKKDSPSLLLGSIVDCILTGGKEEFDANYIVRDINISDSGISICKALAAMPSPYTHFNDIPEHIVSAKAREVGFWQSDKWDKRRYSEVLKTGDVADYYNSLINSEQIVITTEVYNTAINMVRALRESPATAGYFADNDELSPIRRYYQLKFKGVHNNVRYRCMMDLAVVDYEKKIIYPIDLKTSGKKEWHFEDSFLQWSY